MGDRADLFALLRAVSKEERSGFLDITFDAKQFRLSCDQGKIVEVSENQSDKTAEIVKRLARASSLSTDDLGKLKRKNIGKDLLREYVVNHLKVGEGEYEKAAREVELETIYELGDFFTGEIKFVRSVKSQKDDPLISIHPGQMMLDLVERGFSLVGSEELESDLSEEEQLLEILESSPQEEMELETGEETEAEDALEEEIVDVQDQQLEGSQPKEQTQLSPRVESYHSGSITQWMRVLNYNCSLPHVTADIITFAGVLFLTFCAFVAPSLIGDWLDAIDALVMLP